MEILILVSITGLVGLAVSAAMFYMAHTTQSDPLKGLDSQERNDLFRRLKFNADRIKQSCLFINRIRFLTDILQKHKKEATTFRLSYSNKKRIESLPEQGSKTGSKKTDTNNG